MRKNSLTGQYLLYDSINGEDLLVTAMMKEIVADASKIWTRISSNCSMMLSQRDLSSSASSSLGPCFSSLFAASAEVSPFFKSV